jgi:hypothetical protein
MGQKVPLGKKPRPIGGPFGSMDPQEKDAVTVLLKIRGKVYADFTWTKCGDRLTPVNSARNSSEAGFVLFSPPLNTHQNSKNPFSGKNLT